MKTKNNITFTITAVANGFFVRQEHGYNGGACEVDFSKWYIAADKAALDKLLAELTARVDL